MGNKVLFTRTSLFLKKKKNIYFSLLEKQLSPTLDS